MAGKIQQRIEALEQAMRDREGPTGLRWGQELQVLLEECDMAALGSISEALEAGRDLDAAAQGYLAEIQRRLDGCSTAMRAAITPVETAVDLAWWLAGVRRSF